MSIDFQANGDSQSSLVQLTNCTLESRLFAVASTSYLTRRAEWRTRLQVRGGENEPVHGREHPLAWAVVGL